MSLLIQIFVVKSGLVGYQIIEDWKLDKFKILWEDNMTYEDQKKELYFANTVIGVIDNVKTPMLMYQEEKDVVRKALRMYIDRIESDMRGR